MIVFSGIAVYVKLSVPEISSPVKKELVNLEEDFKKEMKDSRSPDIKGDEFVKSLEQRYSRPEAALEYLFALSLLEETDLYPDAFTIDQYMNDVFNKEGENKEQKVKDIMERLTRDGKLTSVQFVKSKMVFDKNSLRVVADLYYNDLKNPIRVNVKLKEVEHDYIGHAADNIISKSQFYYIDSSVWDIIDKIERNI